MAAVLVLEPDPGIQRLLEVLLRREGYTTRCVEDGRSAVRALAEEKFDLMIVDITIGPSTLERGARRGIGFLHWLQKHDPGALQHVIAVSALADRDLHGKLPPVRCFLHKPFGIEELRDAVEKCGDAYLLASSRTQ